MNILDIQVSIIIISLNLGKPHCDQKVLLALKNFFEFNYEILWTHY